MALFHSIIQRLIINNNQIFNICQQEYYCVIDELKCHNYNKNTRKSKYSVNLKTCFLIHATHATTRSSLASFRCKGLLEPLITYTQMRFMSR